MKKVLFIALLICIKQLNAQVCFKPAQTYTTNYTAYSVRNADFDHNGIPDLVAVSCTSGVGTANLIVYMNYLPGTSTFSTTTTYSLATNSNPNDLAVADFDGDTKQDVIVINNSGNGAVSVLQGNGNGTFGTANTFTTIIDPTAIAVADFNKDGKQDFATISNSDGGLAIHINASTGANSFAFNPPITYTMTSLPFAIEVANFNTDTFPDIALSSATSNNVSQLLNTGSGGNMGAPTAFSVGSNPYGLTVGDFNNDGKQDIATPNYDGYNISVLIGTAGSFSTAVSYSLSSQFQPDAIITIDFNGDGNLDLATVGTTSPSVNGFVEVLLGTGLSASTFGAATPFSAIVPTQYNYEPTTIITGDYDLNGTNDVVFSQYSNNSVSMYINAKPVISGNPSICAGASTVLTASASTTYTWSTNAGSATTASVSLTPTVSTTYTVTATTGTCSASTVQIVTVNANPAISISSITNAVCFGICNGVTTATVTGGTTPYSYIWSPTGGTNATATNLCAGNYSVGVTDANGCFASGNAAITQPTAVIVSISPATSTVCIGTTVSFTGTASGGTSGYSYSWTPAGGSTISMTDTLNSNTVYTLTATDASNCSAIATASASINLHDNIGGTIYDTTTTAATHTITAGIVYLYSQQSATTTIDTAHLIANRVTASINFNGSYLFNNVVSGNYYIEAVADTNVYSGSVETYLSTNPNAYLWSLATIVTHSGCTNSTDGGHDITVIETPAHSGTGIIGGTITADTSFGSAFRLSGGDNQVMGAPLKGIDVKLGKNPGGGCAARTNTNQTNGGYIFTDVDTGSYNIYADIPNFGMVVILTATITAANPQNLNNNYCVDSVSINVCASPADIEQVKGINDQVLFYPNPNNGVVNLQMNEYENASVEIYDIVGQKVLSQAIQNNLQQLNITALADGVYQISILKNNTRIYQSKIIKR